MNFSEVRNYMHYVGGSTRGRDNFEEFLKEIDNPHKKIRTIQVLGTNGKGSTSAFLQKLLENKYEKVATFTSPAIVDICDRIQINRSDIPRDDFVRIFNEIHEKAKRYHLGFFEILSAIAFIYFDENNVDYAVIEAGIGGKRDCTSAINAQARLLTNVGYDHTEILGDSIEEILIQKIGACNSGDTLITTINKQDQCEIIDKYCRENHINLIYVKNKTEHNVGLVGEYQKYNAALAHECVKFLGINLTSTQVENAFNTVVWRGRFEKIRDNFYIDGAHNIDGVINSMNTANDVFGKGNYNIISSVLKGKDIYKFEEIFKKNAKNVVFTTFSYPRAYTREELSELDLSIDLDLNKLINNTFNSSENFLFIGSLYFMTEIINILNNEVSYDN